MAFVTTADEASFLQNVECGSVLEVQKLINRGVNVNIRSAGIMGNTALHFISSANINRWRHRSDKCYLKIIELLLDNGADIHSCNNDGVPAFIFVLTKGTIRMIKVLLNTACGVNRFRVEISKHDDIRNIVRLLINKRAIFKIFPRDYPLLLHFCLLHKDEMTFKMILNQYAFDVNYIAVGMNLPIIHSVINLADCSLIEELVNHGADVERRNMHGATPLHFALLAGRGDHVLTLLNLGACVHTINSAGQTALHIAVQMGLGEEIVQEILDAGIDINVKNTVDFTTPLHEACRVPRCYKMVRFLVRRQANLEARDFLGETPFFLLMRNYGVDDSLLIDFFLKLNVSVNHLNNEGDTPLSSTLKVTSGLTKHLQLLVAHLAMMGAMNFLVCHKNIETLHRSTVVRDFYSLCQNEICKMKRPIYSETVVTYFDFVTSNPKKLVAYARNVMIVKYLQSKYRLLREFPIYGNLLRMQFNSAKMGAELYHKAIDALYIQSGRTLPYDALNIVAGYLNEDAFYNVIAAFSDE